MESYYAILAEKGFLNLDEIKEKFSKFNTAYIGHPNNKLPGIEMNSGSLGHGLPVMCRNSKRIKNESSRNTEFMF